VYWCNIANVALGSIANRSSISTPCGSGEFIIGESQIVLFSESFIPPKWMRKLEGEANVCNGLC
jgi:hypothetical protein